MRTHRAGIGLGREGALLMLSAAALGGLVARRLLQRRPRLSFRGRVVLITGATRGLGLAMTRELVREGARVWIVARSREELSRAVAHLKERGGWVRAIRADIRDPLAAEMIVDEVVSEAGRIDVLINNAGVITVAPFEHIHLEDVAESMATHFWGPLRLIRAALPHLTCDGSGRIVNISSIGGRIGVPHLGAYAAGKFALVGLSETLRAELKREGIKVTTVTPGLMRTGSYVNARVRGRHQQEARWFSLSAATPFSAKNAARAARQILNAARLGKATCTPGWQARLAHIASAISPEFSAAAAAFASAHILPRPTAADGGDEARSAGEIDPGWARVLLAERTRRKYHQPDVPPPAPAAAPAPSPEAAPSLVTPQS